MKTHYYDIVASICTETHRVDDILICGGFETVQKAMDFIDKYNVSETDYYHRCKDNETVYIEIEEHGKNGTIIDVITIN